jgi:hypothetical protein
MAVSMKINFFWDGKPFGTRLPTFWRKVLLHHRGLYPETEGRIFSETLGKNATCQLPKHFNSPVKMKLSL